VVGRALGYIRGRQLENGCITDDSRNLILGIWDSVHAFRAFARWKEELGPAQAEGLERVRAYLKGNETPEGLMSWGDREPGQYSAETSSEYMTALLHAGARDEAAARVMRLRGAQQPSGAWRENHSHIPEVFQTMPSVTAFVLRTFCLLGLSPARPEQALQFLVKSQSEEGHWGYNWYYNAVPYYVTMPVTDALARYSCYAPLAKARDYVLRRQRPDGSWSFDAEGFVNQLSSEVHTTYALETLMSCGLEPDERPVRAGVEWLLSRQREDGSWHGGVFPYPPSELYRAFRTGQDVYGTAAILVTLHRYLHFQ
jgi:prenyltransferase beta subunit